VDATCILLRDLIDYAGLFPPASLSMAQSVANYGEYLRSEHKWILGRFVVPVARLGEFEEAFDELPAAASQTNAKWRLSVLLGTDVVMDVTAIREFHDRMANSSSCRKAAVEAVEINVANDEEVTRLSAMIPAELATYFEVPLANCGECIAAVSANARCAKIRAGGETAEKFPDSESVIEFIRLCTAAHVPFKATAGLHHPLRSVHRFNYHPESPSGMMHGFLNVFLAAAFLRTGMEARLAIQLLEEQAPRAFRFNLDGISWREHRLKRDEIALARANFAVSFGSCSFTEPIDDLRSLHLL
jgi:hypothetical protein